MTALATLMVLGSALMHATWNLLAKRSEHPLAFLWLVNSASMIIYVPFFLWILWREGIPGAAWPFILATGLLHIVYITFLSQAYRYGALSIAYPMSRGTGVALVPLFAVPLLGEELTYAGIAGIALVITGILGLHARALEDIVRPAAAGITFGSRLAENRGALYALLTGLAIAGYSLVDKAAMEHVHPLVYGYLIFVSMTVGITPFVLMRQREHALAECRLNPGLVLLGGILVQGTYLIILGAMTIAPVSYIVPLREVSVLFGATLGVVLLGEGFGRGRLISGGLITAGVVLIALLG